MLLGYHEVSRERRVSNYPLCSFPSIPKKSHLILLPTSTRSRCICSIHPVLAKELSKWDAARVLNPKRAKVRSNAKEHVQPIESTDHRQLET